MTKVLVNQFDKSLIHELPKDAFAGKIVVIDDEQEADKAVDYLLEQDVLGFDTETRPSFKKGRRYEVSLLQVATHDVCFLFRLNKIGMPESIVRLLSGNGVLKIGLSWHDDLCALYRRKKFDCGSFVELQEYARGLGITDMSLQKMYANVFGKRIAKGQRLTNWERDELTEAQKLYAATDAWACVALYEEMQRLMESGGYELHINTTEENVQEPASQEG